MRRTVPALLVLLCGCLPSGFRVGGPPIGDDSHVVKNALTDALPSAFEDAVRADGIVPDVLGRGNSGFTAEWDWYLEVRCRTPDEGRTVPVPPAQYVPILKRVEDAVTRTLRGLPGVEVWEVVPTRAAEKRAAATGFVVRYGRKGGAVGGEVVGLIEPQREKAGGYTILKVVASEWCTE